MHAATALQRRFAGFPHQAISLLSDLSAHNERDWFQARKQAFDALVIGPALDLISELGPPLRRRISQSLRVEPRVGGSLLRLQRDARFARREPYRSHIELWFWEGPGRSHEHSGCFVRIGHDTLTLGAGLRDFPSGMLDGYRAAVDAPDSGRDLVAILYRLEQTGWAVAGSIRRRVPAPYDSGHERAALLSRAGLYAQRSMPLPEAVFSRDLIPLLAAELAPLRHLHRWLARVA